MIGGGGGGERRSGGRGVADRKDEMKIPAKPGPRLVEPTCQLHKDVSSSWLASSSCDLILLAGWFAGSRKALMADWSASRLPDESQDPGQGSSEAFHSTLQDTKEQEDIKGEAAVATSVPMRGELVQSAVSFLKHPKVVASSHAQRLSFLENKGLTVDEIDEAFRRLLSPPSNPTSSNTCTSQGISVHSCRITQQEAEIGTERVDASGMPDPETVIPVVPPHPKSYMEVMEMIQRGERPDDIQDINDEPPNPDQPISEPRMAPKPKPWEKQGQESSSWDLKGHSSNSSESGSEVQNNSTNQATGSNNSSNQGDLLLMAEPAMGSEAITAADDAASPKQQL